jgi:hypothetical protein
MPPRPTSRSSRKSPKAAAGLHHTHIVPVHFVGCERGVHFYAMQFIDGLTLAELIRQLRQPAQTAEPAGERGISRRQLFDTIRQYGLHEQGNEPEA